MPVSQRRRDTQQLISLIARCDPLDRPTMGWSRTSEADAMVRRIAAGELTAPRDTVRDTSTRRRNRRPAIMVAALLIAGAGVAAAAQILGGPAPSQVKEDLASVDQGMPPDLRYNPDVQSARLVAQADGASLYYANLADGGYCSEIVTPISGPAGAICVAGANLEQEPLIHVTVPFDDPLTLSSPFVVGGRVNVGGATSLEATFADGSTQSITLGDDGFFVFAVATAQLAEANQQGLRLVANDATGTEIASVDVPPTDFSNPAKQDARQPIFVSTISTQSDFTKVLGVEGSVNIPGAVTLELRYPDGHTVDIPLAADGHYHYDVPEQRTGDLFDTPGWLIARDASGNELARTAVAAVAYWRSANP
jgi:hypothetical protein